MFQDLKDTIAGITDSQESLRGTVRLLGGMTVCLYVFPPLLTELKRAASANRFEAGVRQFRALPRSSCAPAPATWRC